MSLLIDIIQIAREAGEQILTCYTAAPEFQLKQDRSPLTVADQASHAFICDALKRLTPDIPVISEESTTHRLSETESARQFWLVDPLDGTKEFLKKTGEFTVNIALIDGAYPCLGVVHAPAIGITYWAEKGAGAWRNKSHEPAQRITVRRADVQCLSIVASKDHAGPKVKALADRMSGAQFVSMGSSLKFCLVAEGKADVYLRDVPTMEWDTAAAQCIVEQAGGSVQGLDGTRLAYAKSEFRNPELLTVGHLDVSELELTAG